MPRYIDTDELLKSLPDDLPYKASVKRVLIQATEADVVPRAEYDRLNLLLASTTERSENRKEADVDEILTLRLEVDELTEELTRRCEEYEKEIFAKQKSLDNYALQYGTVRCHQKVIDKAKAEVAREIFEEIEREIVAALRSNYNAKQERVEKQIPDDFVSYMCEGKIAALRGIDDFLAELKKKYIGDKI